MKAGIIGAGNMGGAIARGLAKGTKIKAENIFVSDVSTENLNRLKTFDGRINVFTSNVNVAQNADLLFFAVKPYMVNDVANEIKPYFNPEKQIVISIAAMVEISDLLELFGQQTAVYRVVPNTAIETGQSLTVISSANTTTEQDTQVIEILNELGKVIKVPGTQIPALMSLSSCGIAYAFRYIRAATLGGVQMGLSAAMAKTAVLQTLRGAITLLETNNLHPEMEIDRVATPGGITIRGLNEMESFGFSTAVIKGLMASKPDK